LSKENYSHASLKELIFRFVKISSTYGGFKFISQFGAFFLTPIYWHYLSPEDYGTLGLIAVLQGVITPIINLGLHSSVERFYYEWNEEERKYKIGALWLISIIISFLIITAIDLSSEIIFPHIFTQVPYNPYFRVSLVTTLFVSLSFFPFVILRITEKSKQFGIYSVFNFALTSVISIFMLSVLKYKVLGVLYGGLISALIMGVFWIIWMYKRIKININIGKIKSEIYYSIPNLPINILEAIGNNFDQYLLEKYLGLKQLGYYSIGNRFGTYFNQLNSSLKTAWFPMTYKMLSQKKDFKSVLPSLSLFYFYVLTIFALSSSLLLREVILLFAREKYIDAYQFVPLFILIYLIRNFGTAWGRGLDLVKKPQYTLFSTIPGVISSMVLLYIWVPRYGAYGAIYAMLVSSLIKTFIYVLIAHIFYPRKFPVDKVIYLCLTCGFLFLIGNNSDLNTFASILFKISIIILFMAIGSIITFGYKNVISQVSLMARKRFNNNT
jgi:O-antigen/teichoic acid export membrane protein